VNALEVVGPTLTLRYATATDAPALFELASDPEVTSFFSWGPYEHVEEAERYIASLPAKREAGGLLDLLIELRGTGPIGVTGLAELSRRDRRCIVGTWLGQRWWGSGANAESKALICSLAFRTLGMERVGAPASTANERSHAALARLGFAREGVLRSFHRHRGEPRDVVVFGLLRSEWERSELADVPVATHGAPPPAWVVA